MFNCRGAPPTFAPFVVASVVMLGPVEADDPSEAEGGADGLGALALCLQNRLARTIHLTQHLVVRVPHDQSLKHQFLWTPLFR